MRGANNQALRWLNLAFLVHPTFRSLTSIITEHIIYIRHAKLAIITDSWLICDYIMVKMINMIFSIATDGTNSKDFGFHPDKYGHNNIVIFLFFFLMIKL